MKFKLVYLNDKTFGQADNWKHLGIVNEIIKSFNPEFEGFIVQTTCNQIARTNLFSWQKCGIKVVELGVETYNNEILKEFRKPQSERTIEQAVKKLRMYGIRTIVNVILGLSGETTGTYFKTYSFLYKNRRSLFALNIYNLAIYADAEIANDIDLADGDSDELCKEKSFWTKEEREAYNKFSDSFYLLGMEIVGQDVWR